MLSLDTKKFALLYLLIILLGLIVTYFVKIDFCLSAKECRTYEELLTNTGIALIGLSGIIFTLQIFSQESLNNYMNSVMEKIIDIKAQHIIEYSYICITAFLFILLPKSDCNVNLYVMYYYISLIVIFVLLGIDLFVTTRNSNKYRIIKKIEKRIFRIVKMVEKDNLDFNKVCKKYNEPSISIVDELNRMNSLFVTQIQCINSILKNSLNDPILFSNGMDTYVRIIKNRLEKRKNTFSYLNVPFLNEVLPNKDNDIFIEKYMIEYLDEFAKIALKDNNRDLLYIIQNTYYSILMIGKENRYKNSNEIELTVKVVFSYYLRFLKDIIQLGNENMLFETIEIFKKLFIENSDSFYSFVDRELFDNMELLSKLSIEKRSLMNFKNVQGLTVFSCYTILNGDNNLKEYKLDLLFSALKKNLLILYKNRDLIKNRDDARVYLDYIFSDLQPYSLSKYLIDYYNNNIIDGEFADANRFDNKEFEKFIDFYSDNLIINCLNYMKNDGTFINAQSNYKFIISNVIIMLFELKSSHKYDKSKLNIDSNLIKCFNAASTIFSSSSKCNESYYELNDLFTDLLHVKLMDIFHDNIELQKKYLEYYYYCIKLIYEKTTTGNLKLSYFYDFINIAYDYKEKQMVDEFLEWFISTSENRLVLLYESYRELMIPFIVENEISYKNIEALKDNIYIRVIKIIKNLNNDELDFFIDKFRIKCTGRTRKSKIDCIIKSIKN